MQFFSSVNVTPTGVQIATNTYNKAPEAFVQLATQEDQRRGLTKHRQYIGNRYVEVFPATAEEVAEGIGFKRESTYGRDAPYSYGHGNSSSSHSYHRKSEYSSNRDSDYYSPSSSSYTRSSYGSSQHRDQVHYGSNTSGSGNGYSDQVSYSPYGRGGDVPEDSQRKRPKY